MNKIKTDNLIARMIERVKTDTTDTAPSATKVSADVFTDQARFEKERQALFYDTPQVIGFAGEVAEPNSYITAESMGIPIVVVRDGEGQLRAFINACGHRGAKVATGHGNQKRLNCGFHGWSYALDGSLAGRPKDDCFASDRSDCGLVSLPVSDRSGIIMVGLKSDMDQARVDNACEAIEPELEGHQFDQLQTLASERYEVAANWKLVVSLSHEGYHFATLHRESLAPMMTSHGVVDEFGLHTRWAFSMKGIEALEEIDRAQWPARFPGAINHTIYPGTVIVVNPADAQIIRVEPGPWPDTSVVHFSGACLAGGNREESLQTFGFGCDIFGSEDLPAAVECQQGLSATGKDFIIGKNEPVVQMWFDRWEQAIQ